MERVTGSAAFAPCSRGGLAQLFALFCLAASLFAQPDGKPTGEWIRSTEPLKQAWGAHVIAEQKLTALIPDLLRVIESPDTSGDADAARFAALDTAIQLNAEVPVPDLGPLVDRFPTEVLILAARSHEDATDLLLKLLDRQHNREAFVAVGDLLTPKRIPGFAKAAMKEFCQMATVYVFNPGQSQGMGGAWAGDAYRPADPPRTGWPDAGAYRLVESSAKGMRAWTPPADGGHTAFYTRTADKSYVDHGFDYSSDESGNNACLRAEQFLALYTETSPSQMLVRSEARLDLVWTTPEAFETAVHGFMAEQRVRFGLLAGQLAARRYLTADEASQARLNLTIQADDMREHDRTPLPDIGDWAK